MLFKNIIKTYIFIYTLIISLLCSTQLWAQDEVQKWLEKENKQLEKYISEQDKQFIEFLKKEWIQIGLENEQPIFNKPKPISLPQYKPDPGESYQNKELESNQPHAETKERFSSLLEEEILEQARN